MLPITSTRKLLLCVSTVFVLSTALAKELIPDPAKHCDACEDWNRPFEPVHLFGNTWHVGTAGLGSVLITSKEGHILIDGGLPQTAPLIAGNIRKAGFRVEDVKLLLNSHMHYDHAGGLAALQRASGATMAASPEGKRALQNGGPLQDDPQFTFGPEHNNYPAVSEVRAIKDGETLRVGKLAITAHFTPGHTTGGTSWSWTSCEGRQCLHFVYADSLNPVSAPGFRFSDDAARVAGFEKSIAVVENLPCDVVLAAHPNLVDLERKLAESKAGAGAKAFVDPQGCKSYALAARQRLQTRLAEEGTAAPRN
jgi:metallo-beta-lactamase class B